MGEMSNKNIISKDYVLINICFFILFITQIIFSFIERNSYLYLHGSVPLEYSFENSCISMLQMMWLLRGIFFYLLCFFFILFYNTWQKSVIDYALFCLFAWEINALIAHLITHYYNISFFLTISQIIYLPFVLVKNIKIQILGIKLDTERILKESVGKPTIKNVLTFIIGLVLCLFLLGYLNVILP